MSEVICIKSSDPIIKELNFKPYRSTVERSVVRFIPAPDEPQKFEIKTPWGESLTANAGDYLISELGTLPGDQWPVEAEIFEKTYIITSPGRCVKKTLTNLVPLADAVNGDKDQEVVVETLEGLISVRAGDFYLAQDVVGAIWPYPKDKVESVMVLVAE